MQGISERIWSLRQRIFETTPEIFADRAEIITESYIKTQGQPYLMRRAIAFRDILERIDICITPGELIVGSNTSKPRGCQVFPEYDMSYVIDELDMFEHRKADRFIIKEENKQKLRRICDFWEGNTIADTALALFDEEKKGCLGDLVFILTALRSGIGHTILDYPMCLNRGITGILEDIATARRAMDPADPTCADKLLFYRSSEICCHAILSFAHRFAALARKKARHETNSERKRELLEITRVCEHVPEFPAQNFHEALQSLWFIHLAAQIESNGHSVSLGRFDQYMYPFYKHDLEKGSSEEYLEELLHAIWIKFFEIILILYYRQQVLPSFIRQYIPYIRTSS